ncbi:MAG: ATP synthase F0 subunit B [Chloroflexi bacterium]|nr:MAG: ATP synthase F0 subunit B [Chloroflexota bacterium]
MAALGIDPLVLIVYIINFGLVLFLLQRFAYKPILGMLEQRQQRISDSLAAADKAAEEAAQQRVEFEKELAKARQSSQEDARKAAEATEKMRQEILAAARQEAEDIKSKAREEAEQEKQAIMADLQKQAADLAMQITNKVVGEAVDENAQRKLVNQFLADLGDA